MITSRESANEPAPYGLAERIEGERRSLKLEGSFIVEKLEVQFIASARPSWGLNRPMNHARTAHPVVAQYQ